MKIAIVNDSEMGVEALRRVVAQAPQHQLAWVAHDGAAAVALCEKETPDLVLMDLVMPVMDGTEATRQIMARCPCAILIVTATVETNPGRVFETLGAGALDVVSTPQLEDLGGASGPSPLLAKFRIMERLIERNRLLIQDGFKSPAVVNESPGKDQTPLLVAIGASAGGPNALAQILRHLPGGFGGAIVIVQHIDAKFSQSMASWLEDQTCLSVCLAQPGDRPQAGVVLIAGRNQDILLQKNGVLEYTNEPAESIYAPSIDVFFKSVARHQAERAVGLLLTGMGRDGALGLKAMRAAGAITLAQDRASSTVYGMPKAAAEIGAAQEILALPEIADRLQEICAGTMGAR